MIIQYKFVLGVEVTILELGLKGKVVSVWSGRRGNEIQVRFCSNGKYEEVYFFEDELTEAKP